MVSPSESESEVGDVKESDEAVSFGGRVASRERILLIWRAMNSAVVGRGWRVVGVEVVRKDREAEDAVSAGVVFARAALSFEIRAALEEASVLSVWLRWCDAISFSRRRVKVSLVG